MTTSNGLVEAVNPTSAVNPSAAAVAALATRPDDDAIIMVNLLRYTPEIGRAAYARYGAVAGETVKARGGYAALGGAVEAIAISGEDAVVSVEWETVILVRYPRRAAYLDMQSDPAYVGAIPDRTAGLSARLLHPFHPAGGDPDDPFRIEPAASGESLAVHLVRWGGGADAWPSSARVELRLSADIPMVADEAYDELVVTRSPTTTPLGELAPVNAKHVLSLSLRGA